MQSKIKLLSILVLLNSPLAFATGSDQLVTCPDISGLYYSNSAKTEVVRFTQNECKTLLEELGVIEAGGVPRFTGAVEFELNGRPVCNSQGNCDAVVATLEEISFRPNYLVTTRWDGHGVCSHKGYGLTKDREGNLIIDYENIDCTDGFNGPAQVTMTKW